MSPSIIITFLQIYIVAFCKFQPHKSSAGVIGKATGNLTPKLPKTNGKRLDGCKNDLSQDMNNFNSDNINDERDTFLENSTFETVHRSETDLKFAHNLSLNDKNKTNIIFGDFECRKRTDGFRVTTADENPYSVIVINVSDGQRKGKCTGSILTDEWVLTAAHCVYSNNYPVCSVQIYAGGNSMRELMEEDYAVGSQYLTSSEFYPHPRYTGNNDYDLAVVKINGRFELTKTVNTIKLSSKPWTYEGYIACTVTGFGVVQINERNKDDDVRKMHSLQLKKPCICGYRLKQMIGPRTESRFICAKSRQDYGLCHGDSGSGLVCDGEVRAVAIQIFHIRDIDACDFTTFVDECGSKSTLTVFEDTCPFVRWINSHVKLFNESEISPECVDKGLADIIRPQFIVVMGLRLFLIVLEVTFCILLVWTGAGVLAVTQEQLAQYVAAQQTGNGLKHQSVAVVAPRVRQAYALQPAEDAGDSPYQQAYQSAYQQAAAAYQPQPAAGQATSFKSFSSSVGKDYQPVYYRPVAQYQDQAQLQPLRKLRPLPVGPGKEPEEDYDPNPAYQFSFDVKDDEFTNYQNRKEQREGDKISGSYSVVDSDGYIRTVTYTADPKEGFKADVTREPTDIRVKLPQPPSALPQQYHQIPQQLVRKQQTQQYLEASAPAVAGPQYAVRPQSVAYVAPQFVAGPQYAQAAPQYHVAKAVPSAGLSAYTGQHRLAAPVKAKASAIGYASQQPTASPPILYQAYQQ